MSGSAKTTRTTGSHETTRQCQTGTSNSPLLTLRAYYNSAVTTTSSRSAEMYGSNSTDLHKDPLFHQCSPDYCWIAATPRWPKHRSTSWYCAACHARGDPSAKRWPKNTTLTTRCGGHTYCVAHASPLLLQKLGHLALALPLKVLSRETVARWSSYTPKSSSRVMVQSSSTTATATYLSHEANNRSQPYAVFHRILPELLHRTLFQSPFLRGYGCYLAFSTAHTQ